MKLSIPKSTESDLSEILVSETQIAQRVIELGEDINEYYGDQEVTIVCILSGALIFASDLIRRLKFPTRLDCLRAESYGDSTIATNLPKLSNQLKTDIAGHHVLLIDDILDTGNTLNSTIDYLSQLHPLSIKTCILLDKKERRQVKIEADYLGFTIPDEFVVGYGLDYAERYRNLPSIGVLKPEFQGKG